MTTRTKAQAGRHAAKKGARWQDYINRELAFLAQKGEAFIVEVPSPVKILGVQRGMVKGHLDTKRTVDYMGHLPTGQAVYLEAKSTDAKTSWPFADVKDHQREKLELAARSGCVAAIYLEHKIDPARLVRYLLPVRPGDGPDGKPGIIAGVTDRRSLPFGEEAQRFRLSHDDTWLSKAKELGLVHEH